MLFLCYAFLLKCSFTKINFAFSSIASLEKSNFQNPSLFKFTGFTFSFFCCNQINLLRPQRLKKIKTLRFAAHAERVSRRVCFPSPLQKA